LNELSRFEEGIVTIIHGHGSERLKDSIRSYLTEKRDDLSFRPGSWPGEGGDGVTLVERAK
jgi:dsDNA-specific endonuclease/ATPase MutS2